MTAKQYYNLVRRISANKDNPKTIDVLLVTLEDADFIYRTKVEIREDIKGKPIQRKL